VKKGRRSARRRRGRPPQSNSEETRAHILEVAHHVFALHGFDDTPVTAIARDAGVRPGTLYYHFDSKAALYEAVASEARTRLNRSLIDPLIAQVTGEPSLESRLITLVDVLVERAAEDISLHRQAFASDLKANGFPAGRAFRDGVRSDLRRLYAGVAGLAPDAEHSREEQELLGVIETLTLGLWHFAMRPQGLERLPVFARSFRAMLNNSLFPDPEAAGSGTTRRRR
jgi:AcrR family transcriptional regulator